MENNNVVTDFVERRGEQLADGKKKELADRALLLQQLEWWAEKETDAFRAYEYAREKREETAKKLGMFVMPHSMRPIDVED